LGFAPESKVPPDLKAQFQEHKAALLALVPSLPPYPAGPWCPLCGGMEFWTGERGLRWRCASCSPPAPQENKRMAIDLSGRDVLLSFALPGRWPTEDESSTVDAMTTHG
jgi:hypothetical protein